MHLLLKKSKNSEKFVEPKKYPAGMQNLFLAGCSGFVCTADNLVKDMIAHFK